MTFQIAVFYVWADLKEFCYLNFVVFEVLLFFRCCSFQAGVANILGSVQRAQNGSFNINNNVPRTPVRDCNFMKRFC